MQAGEAASLADVCPSADIRARCSDGIARKHGHLLGVPLLGSQSRLKGTASGLNRKQTSQRKFPVFPPHPTLGHSPVFLGNANATVMVHQSLVELGEVQLWPPGTWGALAPPWTRRRRSLTCMCPWYILLRRRQGSRGCRAAFPAGS